MAAQMIASAAWSKLPRDLLGEVYARIAPPLGRVRFTSVCRSWRVVRASPTAASKDARARQIGILACAGSFRVLRWWRETSARGKRRQLTRYILARHI
mgnify:CR=1 FL=1